MISLLYASFEDMRAPSIAPLIYTRTPIEHQHFLEWKKRNSLDFDGIGAGLVDNRLGLSNSLFCEKKMLNELTS